MIRENPIAERIVIESHSEIVRWLSDADITSRRLIEQILKEEEDHADELTDLYEG
jgi:bacterioferritin